MAISGMRSGLFAGPIFIAAAIGTADAAQASPCAGLVEAFDRAVTERAVDAAVRGLEGIADAPACRRISRQARRFSHRRRPNAKSSRGRA
jgi:hypothetical protein